MTANTANTADTAVATMAAEAYPGIPEAESLLLIAARGETKEERQAASEKLIRLDRERVLSEQVALRDQAQEDDADLCAPVLVKVSSVTPERVRWLWSQRIPLGKITVFDGDPSLGKSTVTLDLAARVSTGAPMPGETDRHEPAGVVLLSGEDGIADTIRPRLEAAGADLGRIVVLTAVRDAEGKPCLPSLPSDVSAIRRAVVEVDARLVVVDPLMAFLAGRVDSHRDQDVRGALAQVAELAEDTGAALVIVRHLTKTGSGHPIYRGGGSIGIIGAARAGLMVGEDPGDKTRRVLAVTKSNLGPIPPSLAYRIVPSGETSMISWEGVAEVSAKDILAAQREDDEPTGARAEAEEFLQELLVDGPTKAVDVFRIAREAGVAEKTLRRAQKALGISPRKDGMGGPWVWSLPPEDGHPEPKMASPERWPSSGGLGHLRGSEALPVTAETSTPTWLQTACSTSSWDTGDVLERQAVMGENIITSGTTATTTGATYRHDGHAYRVGDILPDGRIIESIDYGIPTLRRAVETEEGTV